jgi:hypothetical protein
MPKKEPKRRRRRSQKDGLDTNESIVDAITKMRRRLIFGETKPDSLSGE